MFAVFAVFHSKDAFAKYKNYFEKKN